MKTKICKGCGKRKKLERFDRNASGKCGRASRCKLCYPKWVRPRTQAHVISQHQKKRCRYCGKQKRIAGFDKNWSGKFGRASTCRPCCRTLKTTWLQENYHIPWAKATLAAHRRNGVTFTFSSQQLIALAKTMKRCAVCENELRWGPGRLSAESPTLDRVDNKLGRHSFSDLQILCFSCNTTKGPRTMSQFISYCRTVSDKYTGGSIQ